MDPTLKFRTLATLKDQMGEMPPRMRGAAKYIIDHPADFGLDSIRLSSAKSKVSTYTFVNIAKRLGFSSFEDLRQPFRHALVASPEAPEFRLHFDAVAGQSATGGLVADAAKNALSIAGASLARQSPDELEAVVDMLFSARTVYLTGVRASYSMAYYLDYVGRMALPSLRLIPRHRNSAIDDLNGADAADVLIAVTITPYSRETIEACAFAKKQGVKLLFISDSEVVSPELAADHTLAASTLSTHRFGSFIGMMAVIEVLLALLMARGGEDARERIASYEKLRNENNAYWVQQKKH